MNEKDSSKVRFYEAGYPSDAVNLMPLFNSFLERGAKHFQGEWSSFSLGKPLLAFDPIYFFKSNVDDEKKMLVLKELMTNVYSIADDFGVDIAICISEDKGILICPGTSSWTMSFCRRAVLDAF